MFRYRDKSSSDCLVCCRGESLAAEARRTGSSMTFSFTVLTQDDGCFRLCQISNMQKSLKWIYINDMKFSAGKLAFIA